MKVALVFPRLEDQVHGMWPPLGLCSLATVLRDAGEQPQVFDSSFDPDLARVKNGLPDFAPDLIGIYTLTDFFGAAKELVEFGSRLGAKTVLGAAHPTILPEQTLREIPALDFLVRGEGEKAVLELVNAPKSGGDLSRIPALGYRRGGEIVLNPLPEEPLDLDQLPIPDRDLGCWTR